MVWLQRAISFLAALLMLVGGVALVLMMAQVTLDVAGKYFLSAPVPVTLEMVSNYYMVAVVFLPIAAVERANGHIHVELIYSHLPRLARRLLDLLAYGLALFFFWLLMQTGWEQAWRKFEVGEFIMGSYSLEIWPSRFLVPIGGGLMVALLALKLVRSLASIVRPELDPEREGSGEAAHQ